MNKQQNIVFFIGAGFSAPFGMPVMSNFIQKAKDLYFSNPEHFSVIFDTLNLIDKYSAVKNYMSVDLYNIEDLLSIAYMESIINGESAHLNSIENFIELVIKSYSGPIARGVISFAKLISNIQVEQGSTVVRDGPQRYQKYTSNGQKLENTSFGIVTLNYDLLIENGINSYLESISEYYRHGNESNPFTDLLKTSNSISENGIRIAKLHGSIDSSIVPPTWNKSINQAIHKDWELATELISNATHIIFLGYSLPTTDNYIKFLFSSSLTTNKRLKKITAITMDSDNNTRSRFENLFSFNFIFHNEDLVHFFQFIMMLAEKRSYDFDSFDNDFTKFVTSEE